MKEQRTQVIIAKLATDRVNIILCYGLKHEYHLK